MAGKTIRIHPLNYPFSEMTDGLFETWLVSELKKSNIPMLGMKFSDGLGRGVLTHSVDWDSGDHVFSWEC